MSAAKKIKLPPYPDRSSPPSFPRLTWPCVAFVTTSKRKAWRTGRTFLPDRTSGVEAKVKTQCAPQESHQVFSNWCQVFLVTSGLTDVWFCEGGGRKTSTLLSPQALYSCFTWACTTYFQMWRRRWQRGAFITGVSKGGKNRTRMISVTDEIAPATPSVVAGRGVRGGKGGRESRWASLQQLGRVKCGSKINTAQGSEIPDGTIFAVRPPHSSDD